MRIARLGRLAVAAGIVAVVPGTGLAQAIPDWRVADICSSDSAREHCILLERQARNAVVAGWPFVSAEMRRRCIARHNDPTDRTWRVLSTCLEEQADQQNWISTGRTPVDMKAYQAEVAARRAELAAEAEQRRLADDDARRRKAEEEARRLAAEAEAKRRAEEAARREAAAAEAKRRAEDDARRLAAEAEAKRLADVEVRRQAAEADARRISQEDAARLAAEADARRRAEAEELRRLAVETEARRRAEDEAGRRAAEAEASRKAADEARRQAEEAETRRRQTEAARRAALEDEAKRRADDEARRAAADADAKRRAEEDARRLAQEAQAKSLAADAASQRATTRVVDACQDVMAKTARRGIILFGHDDATLDASSHPTLDQIARAAKVCSGVQIAVDGHTNDLGTAPYNQGLSERRAASVVGYLTKAGVSAASLSARGFGKSKPVAPNTTPEGLAKNRRIEFTLSAQ